jgi:hypothetical protein
MGIEAVALGLAVIVRLVEKYTGWFNLGEEWNTWLGGILMYWAALPTILLGLVVGVRRIKSGWTE